MYTVLLQSAAGAQNIPTTELPTEWAVWIILTLLGFIGAIFLFLKWLIGLASRKTDSILKDFKEMHADGMHRLESLKDNQIKIRDTQIEIRARLDELKTDGREVKYEIRTLNTKVKCVNE